MMFIVNGGTRRSAPAVEFHHTDAGRELRMAERAELYREPSRA